MRKVLIVEDDASVAGMVRELLLTEGYLSVHAADTDSAWATLIAEDPDAAILDLWLYGRDSGWELLDRIRGNEHFQTLPVVILTGVTGSDTVEKAHAQGAEYLNKPFTPAALIDRLRRVMRAAGRAPALRTYEVVLLTPKFRVEGSLHVTEELTRFSDAWEALVGDSRIYLPLTDATIKTLDGSETFAVRDILEVRKSDVTAVFLSDA